MADVFIGSEALARGALSRGHLRWNYRTIFPDVYTDKGATLTLADRTIAAWLWSRRRGVIAGLAAAAVHGARWVEESTEVELIWRCGRPPPGIVVRNERIEADEIVEIAGLPVTSPERTALDLARHAERNVAVSHLDALARATGITGADVASLIDRYPGGRGVCRSIAAVSLMDGGSRSPRETLIRLALIDAGFPAPKIVAPTAIGYDAPKVGIAFDATETLPQPGWTMISGADVRNTQVLVCLLRMAVIERGYPLWRLQRVASRRT